MLLHPRHARFGRAIALLAALGGLVGGAPPAAAQAARPQEYEVMAAHLYSFGKFVAWPASSEAAGSPFLVCVLGHDPFGPALDATMASAVVWEKPVAVRRVAKAEDARGCQIIFVSVSEEAILDDTLEALGREPVLTVGESPRFAERGGMIEFVVQASRVRFAVNVSAAEAAGLALSSELLRVATTVIGAPAGR
jgi:hypothetical protein